MTHTISRKNNKWINWSEWRPTDFRVWFSFCVDYLWFMKYQILQHFRKLTAAQIDNWVLNWWYDILIETESHIANVHSHTIPCIKSLNCWTFVSFAIVTHTNGCMNSVGLKASRQWCACISTIRTKLNSKDGPLHWTEPRPTNISFILLSWAYNFGRKTAIKI